MALLLTWLVHGLAIALVTRFALRTLPGLSAATRYAVWWAALVLVLILPIVRGLTIGASASAGAGTGPDARAIAASSVPDAFAASSTSSQGDVASIDAAGSPTPRAQSFSLPSLPPISLPRLPDWFVSIVIGLWLGSAMLGLAQLAYSVQAVRRLKASCRRMMTPRQSDLPMWSAVRERGRTARVRASDSVRTAAVLGLTRPIIAVPRDAAEALTAHEIDQVVLHEYAHVQRYDDWTKLLQVLIGAFAGWHPAVRLMMREIDFEREAACDDYVVDVTGAPRAYARCLTKVIEMMPGSSLDLAAVPHAYSSARHATTRIERLLDRERPSGRLAVLPAMAGSLTLTVLAFCTVHALPIATDLPHAIESEAPTRDTTFPSATAERAAASDDTRAAIAPDANAAVVAGNVDDDDAWREHAPVPASAASSGSGLRIAAASTLPIDLPFSRFSPLSRLTDTRLGASRTTPSAAAPTPARLETSTPGLTPAATSPSTGVARAESSLDANAAPVGTAGADATPSSPSTQETRHVREPAGANSGASAAQAPGAPALAAMHGPARGYRSGAVTRRPVSTPDMRHLRDGATPRAETTFALGPVVAAGDSDAMPEASESGHIGRAWENTRDATSKAVGVSARAVGSATKTAGDAGARAVGTATKTAGDATKTATNKAAAGLKASGTQTKRAFGRVKRTLASVF